MAFMKWLADFFNKSSRVHVHRGIGSIAEAIGVIDRFVDGNPNYPLEWDDFISWKSQIAGVEKLRNEIADMEPMFFPLIRALGCGRIEGFLRSGTTMPDSMGLLPNLIRF